MSLATFVGLLFLAGILFASAARAETHVVTIHRMAFEFPQTHVRVGDTIEWVNKDSVPHTASSDDAGFDETLGPGDTARSSIARAGQFDVTCRYHPGMRGVLRVRDRGEK